MSVASDDNEMEHKLDLFESAWSAARQPNGPARPHWRAFSFSSGHPREKMCAVHLIIIDLQNRLGVGDKPPLVAEYLCDRELNLDQEQELQIIQEEYLDCWRHNRPVPKLEYCKLYPHLSAQLETLLIPSWDCPVCGKLIAEEDESTVSLRCPSCSWEGLRARLCPPKLPKLGGYDDLSLISTGGMGVVYKAWQRTPHRLVALKMLLTRFHTAEHRRRFLQEANAIAKLEHPNIIHVYDAGDVSGEPYLSLEYCAGGTLATKLNGTPLSPKDAAELMKKLAEAVHYAHTKAIAHRDLKPANVLYTEDGIPKIADFGLAKEFGEENLTQTGAILGTPSYMAPEQARGESPDFLCDVYALGAILYECLTGRPPFKGDTPGSTLDLVRHNEPVPPRQLNPNVPKDLETICLKCLQKSPQKRYASAELLSEDLTRYQNHEPIHARPVGEFEKAWKWARRHPGTAATIVALLVGGPVILGLLVFALILRGKNTEITSQKEEAITQRNRADLLTAELSTRFGEDYMDAGDYPRGTLWFVRGLRQLPNGEQARDAANRRHIAAAVARLHTLEKILPHTGIVRVGVPSPDGKYLLIAGDGPMAVLADASTGVPVFQFPALDRGDSFCAGAFSSQGDMLLLACEGKNYRIRTFRTRSGEEFGKSIEHTGVKHANFTLDGKRILAVGHEGPRLRVYDLVTREPTTTGFGCAANLYFAALSPDGAAAVTVGTQAHAVVWELSSGKSKFVLPHKADLFCAAYHPTQEVIATGDLYGNVFFWNAVDGRPFALSKNHQPNGDLETPLKAHTDAVRTVQFSPDGTLLLTSSQDGSARVWFWNREEPANCKPHGHALLHTGQVHRATFTPDGRRLFTVGYDEAIREWQLAPKESPYVRIFSHRGPVATAVLSRDGQSVLVGCKEVQGKDGESHLYEAATGKRLGGPWPQGGEVMGVALSRDGKVAVTVGNEGTARAWDCVTGKLLHGQPFSYPGGKAARCAFSPLNDRLVAVGGRQGRLLLLDLANGKTLAPILEGIAPRWAWVVEYSPDGQRLLAVGGGGDGQLWDTKTLTKVGQALKQESDVRAGGFSPCGRFILTCGLPQTARLWSAVDGTPLHQTALLHNGEVLAGAFSPDGEQIVTASTDGTVSMWEVESGKKKWESLHRAAVRTVAFSRNGRLLVSGCDDGRVQLLDPSSGTQLGAVLRHAGRVNCVSFTPDSLSVLTGSEDGTARLWSPPAMISEQVNKETISDWVSGLTGMRLEENGVVVTLTPKDWQALRDKLAATEHALPIRPKRE